MNEIRMKFTDEIIIDMRNWRKDHDKRYRSAEIFWEEYEFALAHKLDEFIFYYMREEYNRIHNSIVDMTKSISWLKDNVDYIKYNMKEIDYRWFTSVDELINDHKKLIYSIKDWETSLDTVAEMDDLEDIKCRADEVSNEMMAVSM